MNPSPIRVMLLEDSPDDADLVVLELRREGLDIVYERFETAASMKQALSEESWDVVISDYSMPSFDARQALDLLLSTGLDIPFIVVSGTIGEETSVEMMRAGASDYLLKDRLHRLGAAVQRELAAVRSRQLRRETEHALIQSETYNRALLRTIPDTIFRISESGTFLDFLSGDAADLTHPTESFLHQRLEDVWPEAVASRFMEAIEIVIEEGGTQAIEYELEVDGMRRTFESRLAACGPGQVMTVARDVTASRDLEKQVRASQRMEALGRLAGGIAHDFNNLMMVIRVSSEFLREALPPDATAKEDIDAIQMASDRATELTRQLLAFSRRQMQRLQVINVNNVIEDLQKFLRPVIAEDIDLVIELHPEVGLIKADPAQIEQVLMNVVLNARDAMPSGGRLAIETSTVWLDDGYESTKSARVPPGPYLMISVSDTGLGMNEAVQAQIFEPFFTTKGGSKGTGLGLATAFGIVKQSHGFIWVYSEIGQGTTFKIYFPQVEDANLPIAMAMPEVADVGGHETVLLVEDEAMVRAVALKLLRSAGYNVLEAAGGGEALRSCQAHDGVIDLLITDVVMPDMSGRDLARELSKLRPEMRVLFVSGYTYNGIGHRGVLDADVMFLSKPFTRRSLLHKVRGILDQEP
ncbi:MAG: response regulator [Thermoanaerobaculia bacterium]|nr:response regulator [Thermoanaerobaculia bacterium]